MMTQLGERRGTKHGMKSATLAWRGMLEGKYSTGCRKILKSH